MTPLSRGSGLTEGLKRQAEAMPRWYLVIVVVFAALAVAGSAFLDDRRYVNREAFARLCRRRVFYNHHGSSALRTDTSAGKPNRLDF